MRLFLFTILGLVLGSSSSSSSDDTSTDGTTATSTDGTTATSPDGSTTATTQDGTTTTGAGGNSTSATTPDGSTTTGAGGNSTTATNQDDSTTGGAGGGGGSTTAGAEGADGSSTTGAGGAGGSTTAGAEGADGTSTTGAGGNNEDDTKKSNETAPATEGDKYEGAKAKVESKLTITGYTAAMCTPLQKGVEAVYDASIKSKISNVALGDWTHKGTGDASDCKSSSRRLSTLRELNTATELNSNVVVVVPKSTADSVTKATAEIAKIKDAPDLADAATIKTKVLAAAEAEAVKADPTGGATLFANVTVVADAYQTPVSVGALDKTADADLVTKAKEKDDEAAAAAAATTSGAAGVAFGSAVFLLGAMLC